MAFLLLIPFLFIYFTEAIPVKYKYQTALLEFSQTSLNKSIELQHYETSVVIYTFASVNISSYFALTSNYTLEQDKQLDHLTFFISVKGARIFKVWLDYIYMQPMPNIQIAQVNLTYNKPLCVYNSKKGLSFNQDIYVAAFLTGFTSSNITKDNFFFSMKNNITYSLYTNTILRPDDWITINMVIVQSNYDVDNMICIGSYIQSATQVYPRPQQNSFQVQKQLNYLFGLEALLNGSAVFVVNKANQTFNIAQFGVFSYSILVFNTTCNKVFDTQLLKKTSLQKTYLGLMITFIIIFICLTAYAIYYFLKKKKKSEKIVRIAQQPLEDNNIRSSQKLSTKDKSSTKNKKKQIKDQQKQQKTSTSKKKSRQNKQQNKEQKPRRPNDEEYIQTKDIDLGDDIIPETEVRLKKKPTYVCNKCSSKLESATTRCKKCSEKLNK